MAWKDNLRPASFRGVTFFVDASQFTGGRRNVFHEFPDRDTPYSEDMGRAGRTFKVDGHILGDNYFTTKTLLIEAVEKFGPGELVHPYFGTLFVQVGAFSVDEDTKEGGIAKVTFQFYEAGDNTYPKSVNDKQAVIAEKASAANAASKKKFDSTFSVEKAPGFVVDQARKGVNKVADLLSQATKGGRTIAEETANLAYGIRNLKAEVNDLIQQPAKLSQRIQDSFALLENALELPKGRLKAYSNFFTYGLDDLAVLGNSINRKRERDNKDAYDKYIRRVSVANAANQAAAVPYESTDEALKNREELSGHIEKILMEADDDEVFAAFEDLQASLTQLVPDDDSDLPNLQTVKVEKTVSSLTLAYDLFENPDLEANLVTRNGIRNPGFILGGTELEVLNV